MSNKIEIRTHHIDCLRKESIKPGGIDAYFPRMSIEYKIGTSAERQKFSDAVTTLGSAVLNDNFTDIGERPDAICRA